jgi:hypothetical protein
MNSWCGRRASTVNGLVRKILAKPFCVAKNKGLIQIDPIAGLKAVRGDTVEKHIFTAEPASRRPKSIPAGTKFFSAVL